ncbi:hypothetical protein BOX15_Mlig023510g1, partial [Macrostomum lignano]
RQAVNSDKQMAAAKPVDLVFAFNTIQLFDSYGCALDNRILVEVAKIFPRLSGDIPNSQLAVIVTTRYQNLGAASEVLAQFLTSQLPGTGDCALPRGRTEQLLKLAVEKISWRQGSSRALVLVDQPVSHDSSAVPQLKQLGVAVYSVHCGPPAQSADSCCSLTFMRHLANETGGLCLQLAELRDLPDFLTAAAYRASGSSRLQYAYECEVRSRRSPHCEAVGMLSLVRRASAETVILDDEEFGDASETPVDRKTQTAVRVARESCTGLSLPAPLDELVWSPWRLIGRPSRSRPALRADRLSWQPYKGTKSVIRRSLLPGSVAGVDSPLTDAPLAVELAVQPRSDSACRCPLFGRVLAAGRPATLGHLLAGRPTVRAQFRRVLNCGMLIFVRLADASRIALAEQRLEHAVSYAWISGRPVRLAGSFVSVDKSRL